MGYVSLIKISPWERYRESKNLFGTIVHVDVCYNHQNKDNLEEVYQEVWRLLEDIHWRMSIFNLSENSPPLFKAGMRANSRNEISGQRLAPTALETVSSPPVKAGESNDQSEVTKINHSYPQPIQISPETYEVIQESLKFSILTKGAFDITVYHLIQFWKKMQLKELFTLP